MHLCSGIGMSDYNYISLHCFSIGMSSVAYILINCTSTEEQGYALDHRCSLHRSLLAQIPNGQGNVRVLLVTMTPITLILQT